jgi:secreted trypsin-like serine protease
MRLAVFLAPILAFASTQASHAVIGGEWVAASDPIASSIVKVEVRDVQRKSRYCTGILIAHDAAITAAHCFGPYTANGNPAQVWIGVPGRAIRSKRFVIHERYALSLGTAENRYDIALIQFNEALPRGYRPIQVMSDDSSLKPGDFVWIAGFGSSAPGYGSGDAKSFEPLKQSKFFLTNLDVSPGKARISTSGTHSPSHGDSGGPAYAVKDDGSVALFGIVSMRDPSTWNFNGETSLVLLTRYAAFAGWVNANLQMLRRR